MTLQEAETQYQRALQATAQAEQANRDATNAREWSVAFAALDAAQIAEQHALEILRSLTPSAALPYSVELQDAVDTHAVTALRAFEARRAALYATRSLFALETQNRANAHVTAAEST